jgi:hypothetical protein
MQRTALEDVQFLLGYELKDSCDEKLLKLVANRSTPVINSGEAELERILDA